MNVAELINKAENFCFLGKLEKAKEIESALARQSLSRQEKLQSQKLSLTILALSNETHKIREICFNILSEYENDFASFLILTSETKLTSNDIPLLEKYEKIAKNYTGINYPHEDLFYALATGYEKLGNYKLAAKYYSRANAIYKNRCGFDFKIENRILEKTPEIFTKAFFDKHNFEVSDSKKMIFVVGMPRSSTSLVEQILASHSKVAGAGEQMLVENLVMATTKLQQNFYPDCFEGINSQQITKLAEFYNQQISLLEPEAEYVVDKMPLNFLHLGLIAAMFPNAKIINCVRDLRDVACSIYSKKFSVGNFWAQDFEDIYKMSKIYRQMMDYWKTTLPIEIYDSNYENLVNDTESETKKLLTYCGLNWDAECLNFHQNKRIVMTASKAQVTQPMFSSSVNRWKKYKPYFSKELRKIGGLN